MKISEELSYGFETNFIRRNNITRLNIGYIFDLDVKGQGHQNTRSNI